MEQMEKITDRIEKNIERIHAICDQLRDTLSDHTGIITSHKQYITTNGDLLRDITTRVRQVELFQQRFLSLEKEIVSISDSLSQISGKVIALDKDSSRNRWRGDDMNKKILWATMIITNILTAYFVTKFR